MTRRSPEELVTVASAQNQAEAEFVQNILRDAGVPSILRRSAGADVPDFLAAGRRDVLVPALLAEIARDALTPADPGRARHERPGAEPRLTISIDVRRLFDPSKPGTDRVGVPTSACLRVEQAFAGVSRVGRQTSGMDDEQNRAPRVLLRGGWSSLRIPRRRARRCWYGRI